MRSSGCEVPPLRRGTGGDSIRRHVSLREPHLWLCTFASPRRVPSGQEVRWSWRPMGKILTADYADERRLLRREQADATPPGSGKNVGRIVPGVCDPGLCYGYAPHTLRMLHPVGCSRKLTRVPSGHEDRWGKVTGYGISMLPYLVFVASRRRISRGTDYLIFLRIRLSLSKICANLRNLRLKLRHLRLNFETMRVYSLKVGGNCNSFGGRTPCSIKVLTAWQRCSEERFRHLSG